MVIADRLRLLREKKNLSQGDVEKRTGLLRCYISRVENGNTVPAIESLEKLARAFDVPLYQLFLDGDNPPTPRNFLNQTNKNEGMWGTSGKDAKMVDMFRRLLSRTSEQDLKILLFTAQRMANPGRGKPRRLAPQKR